MPDQPYISTSRRNASLRVDGASSYLYYTTSDEKMSRIREFFSMKYAKSARSDHKRGNSNEINFAENR